MEECNFNVCVGGTTYPCYYIKDTTRASSICEQLLNQPDELYGIDTETAALPKYRRYPYAALSPHLSTVRLLQLFTGRTCFIFDCFHIDPRTFTRLLEGRRWVGHNAIFDLQYFYKYFGVRHMDYGCTYLATKLIFHASTPDDTGLSASLESVAESVLKGVEVVKAMQASDWSIPELTFEQVEYAALDPIYGLLIVSPLGRRINKLGLSRIYNLYKSAQHPIAKMQLNGLKLDEVHHREMMVKWQLQLIAAKKKLWELTKMDKLTAHTMAKYLEENLEPEIRDIWPRTEAGKFQTDSHAFADFDFLPVVKPFSAYQKAIKLTTSFGQPLLSSVNPESGRLHARFNLAGARTGRLSCSKPNLQQLPRDKEVRKCFIPEEGNVFLCSDYSQVELRVAAEVSRDDTMLRAYRDGVDLHMLTASKLVGEAKWNTMTKEEKANARQMAKAFNFGLLFGLGAKKFSHYAKKSYRVVVSKEEAQQGVDTFRDTYSGYHAWQRRQAEIAAEQGFVTTPCGKRRSLKRGECYGASMNTPIQGGAAECVLYSLVHLQDSLNGKGALVNCVHDEIIVEALEENAAEVKHLIETSMVKGYQSVFPDGITRDLSECHSGRNWAEAKSAPKPGENRI